MKGKIFTYGFMAAALLSAVHAYCETSLSTNRPRSHGTGAIQRKGMFFAILDHDYVMQESQAARQARIEIDARRGAFQEELSRLEQQLRDAEKKLIESQQTLDEANYARKRQEFEENVSKTHAMVSQHRNQLEESFNQAREVIVDAILKTVADISREKGYQVVLPRSMIFYAEESYDITDEVLERLNRKLPTVALDQHFKAGKETRND